MVDYKSMYFELFNAVTECIEILKKAQLSAEDAYISSAEEVSKDNDDGEPSCAALL